ncbi:MAG: translocation/assembly module TamB [Bacteroidales bacterium]|nr:translocation/assembly module TamB [Bacteroidales bacterium]
MAVLTIPTALIVVINNERVQNFVAEKVTELVSEKLGNHVTIGHVQWSWFSRLTLTNLNVTGLEGDTILHAPELIAKLNLLAFSTRKISISKVQLNQAVIHLEYVPERDEINLKFIIERLKSKDTTGNKPRWDFGIQSVELNDCYFSFCNSTKVFDRPFGMDYASLSIAKINLHVTDFGLGDAPDYGVRFHIRQLSCQEQCGLTVRSFRSDFVVNRKNLSFKNVHFITTDSEVDADNVSFSFDSFQDFGNGGFLSKVQMSIAIRSSNVKLEEISHFAPVFQQYSDFANVSGNVTGTVDNMKGDNIHVTAGNMTDVNCNFDLKGLPEIRTTFIYTNVTRLKTCPEDIERVRLKRNKSGHVELPAALKQLTEIGFTGNFTGFFDDFVTYGTFDSNLGNLSTDLSIKPTLISKTDTSFTFHGQMKTDEFHLGRLLGTSSIGKITMDGMVKGMASGPNHITADIEGMIRQIRLKDYDYKAISINGAINNRAYDGKLYIDEPNVKVDFSGKVDMTNPTFPDFNFTANVERARLHELKLAEDTSSFIAFNITADFSGTNIDNIMGQLNLKNSLIRRYSREIEINDLLIFTKAIRDTNRFILRSDILNAEVWGQYQFLKLPESFFALVKNYSPAWGPANVKPEISSGNSFRFVAEFNNTEKLTNFFIDEFRVAKGTKFEGKYNPSQKDVHFVLDVPYVTIKGKRLRGFFLNGSCEDSTFVFEAGCETLRLNNNMSLKNFTLLSNTRSDSTTVDVRWNNWDSILNKGNLHSVVRFERTSKRQIPSINIATSPGQIVTSGDKWALTHEGIAIDSSMIKIHDLLLKRNEQEINVFGFISNREQDKLVVHIKDLNLSAINSSMQLQRLKFDGTANGKVFLSNLYKVPVVVSDLHVDSFTINEGLLGNTDVRAVWNSSTGKVNVKTEAVNDIIRTVFINGAYDTNDETLDFDVKLQKVPVKIAEPYIETVFTDIEGEAVSDMKLSGTLADPKLNGEVTFKNAAMTLDYTRTRYAIGGKVNVNNNVFNLKDVQITDRFKNTGKLSGNISAENLKNLRLDITVSATNIEVLNTTERDNNLFYGKAFASGKFQIKGVPADLAMNVAAKTEKNTQLSIPVYSEDEVKQSSFITFVDHTPRAQKKLYSFSRRRSVRTTADGVEQKIAINLDLQVTPAAEVQLVFDSKIGDIMRARGSGDMTLNVTNSQFNMYGSYIIDQGDYLFTLRNVINKHFVLEKGGMITWNGNPLNALLNLKAKYSTTAPLTELMGTNETGTKNTAQVECILYITNTLLDPNIRFEIAMPYAQQEVRSFLSAATNTEEEMTKQFLWLMMVGRFYVDPSVTAQNHESSSSSGVETVAMATATEFMTNQLSHMLSNNSFDVNLKYHPGTGPEGQNFGVDVSTEKWSLSMDYEVGGMKAAETSSNIVGDFTFEYNISKNGKLKLKAFNRSNNQYFIQSPYTQGIGVLYREDFSRMKDLFSRKEEKTAIKPEEEQQPDEKPEEQSEESEKTISQH